VHNSDSAGIFWQFASELPSEPTGEEWRKDTYLRKSLPIR
jgi:hypothetical protein